MVFLESGEAALDEMRTAPFDVLVTDMRMPVMDGAELLARVHQDYPSTVRIILSGTADLEASMRSVSVSHQFLIKPCEAAELKGVVRRACGLHALLDNPRLQRVVGTITELPVVPRVYRALTSALTDPDVDLGQIADIVEQDIAIAAKVLQLVNSSFFGIRQEITSLRQATSYLGVNTIRDLVLSFEVFNQLEASALNAISLDQEQEHSLFVGRLARRLLEDKFLAEYAFLAGLLHDVGKLVLAAGAADLWEQVVASDSHSLDPPHLVEEEMLGVSHAEVGAYLLGLWGMPYPVVEAVAHHHHPSAVADQVSLGVLGAVHAADGLAREVMQPESAFATLDEEYLAQVAAVGRLPEWRAAAADEVSLDDRDAA